MERLTRKQAAIIGAYTGILCGPFDDMQEYIEKVMGRPVWAHEMAFESFTKELKEKSKADFLALCAE
jgi:hypothetical protein